MNGVNADDEIENTYPSVIQEMESELADHEQRIKALEQGGKTQSKEFVIFNQSERMITFKRDITLLITTKNSKCCKGQLLLGRNFYGTKYGNTITTIQFEAGKYSMGDFLGKICNENGLHQCFNLVRKVDSRC